MSQMELPEFKNNIVINYKDEKRIRVEFAYDALHITNIKKLGGRWSASLKCWHLPYTDKIKKLMQMEDMQSRHKFDLITFKKFMQSSRYSENTIDTYMDCMKIFAEWMKEAEPASITNEDVETFMQQYAWQKKLSISWQRLLISALKLYYRRLENRSLEIENIRSPRKDHKLPNVLSHEEIKLILDSTKNLKHKAMLSITYACGLRSGEVLNLRKENVDSKRMYLRINNAKGRKDRIVPFGEKLLNLLREYYKAYRPAVYLFEGITRGEQYSARSFQEVLKQQLKAARIHKPATLHWLRHSYATHLLESGTATRYIQELLGHSSSRTTEIYTHVSTASLKHIKSPFDSL
jgi:integrase/recombinase XerD